MKSARACRNLTDIRGAVNAIDRELIRLLVTRRRYALAALAFKPDRGSVAVPQHRKKIFAQRESWAVRAGLNPTMVH